MSSRSGPNPGSQPRPKVYEKHHGDEGKIKAKIVMNRLIIGGISDDRRHKEKYPYRRGWKTADLGRPHYGETETILVKTECLYEDDCWNEDDEDSQ